MKGGGEKGVRRDREEGKNEVLYQENLRTVLQDINM